jgi:hypothetical protein
LEPSLGEATCAEVAGAFLRGDDVALSGGVARAGAGDLLVMVSGSEAAVHRVRPLLEAMASSAPVVGPQPGDGQKGQTRQPAALRRPHRGRGRRARLRRSHAARRPPRPGKCCARGAAASFMLDDCGDRMVHGADQVKSALTSSSRTWASCSTPPGRTATPPPSRPPPSGSTWPVAAPGSDAATTRPASMCSVVGRPLIGAVPVAARICSTDHGCRLTEAHLSRRRRSTTGSVGGAASAGSPEPADHLPLA